MILNGIGIQISNLKELQNSVVRFHLLRGNIYNLFFFVQKLNVLYFHYIAQHRVSESNISVCPFVVCLFVCLFCFVCLFVCCFCCFCCLLFVVCCFFIHSLLLFNCYNTYILSLSLSLSFYSLLLFMMNDSIKNNCPLKQTNQPTNQPTNCIFLLYKNKTNKQKDLTAVVSHM